MDRYNVSVVVPTYNSGLFLNAFFDSMMYQSIGFENIQVIFVDDNLTKAVIFPSVELANKQRDVLAGLNPEETFTVKQIVLQDIQQ